MSGRDSCPSINEPIRDHVLRGLHERYLRDTDKVSCNDGKVVATLSSVSSADSLSSGPLEAIQSIATTCIKLGVKRANPSKW